MLTWRTGYRNLSPITLADLLKLSVVDTSLAICDYSEFTRRGFGFWLSCPTKLLENEDDEKQRRQMKCVSA